MSDYKKLVNAFRKIGKGWGDSKTNKYTWKYAGFKNSRQWARYIAGSYDMDFVLKEVYDSCEGLSQACFDYFAEEEISAACWQ